MHLLRFPKNLLVTIWSPRAGTRQEKLHLLPGRHFVQPGQFVITCIKKTRAKLLFYLQSLAKELTESDLTSHEYFSGFEKSGAAGVKFRSGNALLRASLVPSLIATCWPKSYYNQKRFTLTCKKIPVLEVYRY